MVYHRNGRTVRVPPMVSADSVVYAVGQRPPRSDPDYTRAVLRSYIDVKLARGKTKQEIHFKLQELERQLPSYGNEFRQIRLEYFLPESRILNMLEAGSLRRTATSGTTTTSAPIRRTSNTLARASTSATLGPAARTSTPATVRQTRPNEDEELPPPPYARMDPEPEQTRLLEERLAAESLNSGNMAPPEPATPADIEPEPTPAPRSPVPVRAVTPPRIPSDEDMRRVWEDSQLEEAKRMSMALERERQEMEEAMRLSLADAEASGYSPDAGPSTAPPAQRDSGPPSRRVSSYESPGLGVPGHRRVASDAGAAGRPTVESITSGVGAMPGGWQHNQASLLDDDQGGFPSPAMLTPMKTGTVMQSRNPFLSPGEAEAEPNYHDHNSNAVFPSSQTPAHLSTPPMATFPPQSSPSQYPSRNSPQYGSTPPNRPQPPYSPSQDIYGSPHSTKTPFPVPQLSPSQQAMRDSPGSSKTKFNVAFEGSSPKGSKPLPRPPTSSSIPSDGLSFDPPPGPPPSHLVMPSNFSSQGPPLPPRRDTAASPQQPYPQSYQAFSPGVNTQIQSPNAMFSSSQLPTQSHKSSFFPTSHPASGPVPSLPTRPVTSTEHGEDPLEMLKEYDTVFLIDDSASMAGEHWDRTKDTLIGVAEIAAGYDDDGIDVYFVNSKRVGPELRTRVDVEDLFAGLTPRGSARTGAKMETVLREYMSKLERLGKSSPGDEVPISPEYERVKPMNLIVVTDRAPFDDLESVIIAAAKRLDRGDYPLSQVGIQFFQIGNDTEAREALQELDDGLASKHDIRDMVDTVPYNGEEMTASIIIKTLLGGINRRLDRR